MDVTVRQAEVSDISAIKNIADRNRKHLGFVLRSVLLAGIARKEVHVAEQHGHVLGFVHWHLRRDGWTTIYEIAVSELRRGLGTRLLMAVSRPLQLKCPVDSEANAFYCTLRGDLVATVRGRRRPLNIWQWSLQ